MLTNYFLLEVNWLRFPNFMMINFCSNNACDKNFCFEKFYNFPIRLTVLRAFFDFNRKELLVLLIILSFNIDIIKWLRTEHVPAKFLIFFFNIIWSIEVLLWVTSPRLDNSFGFVQKLYSIFVKLFKLDVFNKINIHIFLKFRILINNRYLILTYVLNISINASVLFANIHR